MLLLSKSTSPKNNRRGGGRENKLKSSWEIKTKLCKSWEIKRNYANWRKLFVWLQLRSRHPFADVAERSGDNFQLFLKKMFLCFARKWNCQSEKFLMSSEHFDNSWTPTWSKSIWSIVLFFMGLICCAVKIHLNYYVFCALLTLDLDSGQSCQIIVLFIKQHYIGGKHAIHKYCDNIDVLSQ